MIKRLNFIACLLIVSLPILIATGPFLSDLAVVLIDIIFLGILLKDKNSEPLNNKYFKYLLVLWLYCSIRSIFSDDLLFSLKSSFLYIRFIILIYAVSYFLKGNTKLIKLFSKIIILTILFICCDALIQYFTGTNLFNFTLEGTDKVNGVFNDEAVLGSYLVRLSPLFFALLYFKRNKKNFHLFITLALILLGTAILLSGSRSSFFFFFFFILFLFAIDIALRKILLPSGIIIFLLFMAASQINTKIYYTFSYVLFDPIKTMFFEEKLTENLEEKKFIIFTQVYHTHYETAFNIFLDNKLFGVGTKMFRKVCDDPRYYVNHNSCTTHPHNFYMQMLAENGLIGFFGLLIIFLKIVYELFKKITLIYSKPLEYKVDSSLLILIGLFMNLWPIVPSGNLFNNWLSILIYLPIGFYSYFKER